MIHSQPHGTLHGWLQRHAPRLAGAKAGQVADIHGQPGQVAVIGGRILYVP